MIRKTRTWFALVYAYVAVCIMLATLAAGNSINVSLFDRLIIWLSIISFGSDVIRLFHGEYLWDLIERLENSENDKDNIKATFLGIINWIHLIVFFGSIILLAFVSLHMGTIYGYICSVLTIIVVALAATGLIQEIKAGYDIFEESRKADISFRENGTIDDL